MIWFWRHCVRPWLQLWLFFWFDFNSVNQSFDLFARTWENNKCNRTERAIQGYYSDFNYKGMTSAATFRLSSTDLFSRDCSRLDWIFHRSFSQESWGIAGANIFFTGKGIWPVRIFAPAVPQGAIFAPSNSPDALPVTRLTVLEHKRNILKGVTNKWNVAQRRHNYICGTQNKYISKK